MHPHSLVDWWFLCLQAAGQETTINYRLLYRSPHHSSLSPKRKTAYTSNNWWAAWGGDMFWGCGEHEDKGCVRFSIRKCGWNTEIIYNNQPLHLLFCCCPDGRGCWGYGGEGALINFVCVVRRRRSADGKAKQWCEIRWISVPKTVTGAAVGQQQIQQRRGKRLQ